MIQAVGFRVLVKPREVEETTASGIVLATDKKLDKGATVIGTVIHVGPEAFRSYNRSAGFKDYFPWVKSGDEIYYAKYSGKWVDDPDEPGVEYLMLNDEDIVGIIKHANNPDNVATISS